MRKRLTKVVFETRPPKTGFKETRDAESPLVYRLADTGARTFCVRARISGRQVRLSYPKSACIENLSGARKWARETIDQCRAGSDPRKTAETATGEQLHVFEKVAARYLGTNGVFKKKKRPWKARTLKEYERAINERLIPQWKGRVIHSITKDEIIDYLEEVADATPVAANRVLAVLSGIMSWYQLQRGSGFKSPIVRGMEPTQETARDRVLSDDELRVIWHVAGKTDTFGSIVRMLLLTAARKSEVAAMCHKQIGADGIWALPGELTKNREPLYLPLSPKALEIIAAQDRIDGSDVVFTIGGGEFKNWGHNKQRFDTRILRRLKAKARANGEDVSKVEPFPNWTLHDLRRTARSLMSRAKVSPDTAERVLNHKIGGVRETYDRHSYESEKRDALERLASLIDSIVS